MKYTSISIQLASPRHKSFSVIIGMACLLFSDETQYCNSSSQPGFKCVLIIMGLSSSNQNNPTATYSHIATYGYAHVFSL